MSEMDSKVQDAVDSANQVDSTDSKGTKDAASDGTSDYAAELERMKAELERERKSKAGMDRRMSELQQMLEQQRAMQSQLQSVALENLGPEQKQRLQRQIEQADTQAKLNAMQQRLQEYEQRERIESERMDYLSALAEQTGVPLDYLNKADPANPVEAAKVVAEYREQQFVKKYEKKEKSSANSGNLLDGDPARGEADEFRTRLQEARSQGRAIDAARIWDEAAAKGIKL